MTWGNKEELVTYLSGRLDVAVGEKLLPGLVSDAAKDVLVQQLVDSVRRVSYVTILRAKDQSAFYSIPYQRGFDPVRGAIHHLQNGNLEESCWLIFLLTHFGRNLDTGWSLIEDVYGGLNGNVWSWNNITGNFEVFGDWIDKEHTGLRGKFGNHRKYESLKPDTNRSPRRVIGSYISWVLEGGGHQQLFTNAMARNKQCGKRAFEELYNSMSSVLSFGRTAKFDYLTMIGKVGVVAIEPGHAYLSSSTGPVDGARILFAGSKNSKISPAELEVKIAQLEEILGLGYMGMQILEDALCNWQKSTSSYKYFKG